jgi:hypothetical protein
MRYFSENASIDIATNFASFDAIDFSSDFPDFLAGTLSARHLLTLIHEATHHWCLTTPVGTALAARTYHAYSDAAGAADALRAGAEISEQRAKALDASILASRTVTAYFVHLLEGMALYAEWRAHPVAGGTYSRPFDIYARFARPARSDDEADLYLELKAALEASSPDDREAVFASWIASDAGRRAESDTLFKLNLGLRTLRTQPSERRRLRQVFASPIDPRMGSYQLGYLFVCALERLCWGHENPDRFMAYIRDYFLSDYALAAIILDPDIEQHALYSEIRQSLFSKVASLVEDRNTLPKTLAAWGDERPTTPLESRTADDFFGRGQGSTLDGDPAFEAYSQRLEAFCEAAGSETVPPKLLRTFLEAGRVLMPLGSRTFSAESTSGERLELRAEDGVELSLAADQFSILPSDGELVSVEMLVNVAGPGAGVSVRWGEHFEVLPLREDAVSKTLMEAVYKSAGAIGDVVSAGQSVIRSLHRTLPHGSEPIEHIADGLLNLDSVALDIVQIYRLAITTAFASDHPTVMDAAWRESVFAAFQPEGLASMLGHGSTLELFVKVCGMPAAPVIDAAQLRAAGMAQTDVEASRIAGEMYARVNGISEIEHDEAVAHLQPIFARLGLEFFGETTRGGAASLL